METDVQIRFVWKLKVLKAWIKSWARIRRSDQLKILTTLEEEIMTNLSNLPISGLHPTFANKLKSLELEHNCPLIIVEEHWRQRSHVVWLKCGD